MSDTLVKVENVSKKFCHSLKRSLWYRVGLRILARNFLGRSHNQNDFLPTEQWYNLP
jgi:lipopolysaccharide transport system ATP-binding protein